MLLLGIDLGTSFIKVAVGDTSTRQTIVSVQVPEVENSIFSSQPDFAEQDPDHWWECVKNAILKANATGLYNPKDIKHIGIAYQMHGLVLTDKANNVLRPSIIWCDSRAVKLGEEAFERVDKNDFLAKHLNPIGNFTAAKLAWVKSKQPEIYQKIDKVLLPGDFIGMRLTGQATTTSSALSEGIFWDFQAHALSNSVLDLFEFENSFFPEIQEVFSNHGSLLPDIALELGLQSATTVTYKAGDQPNNALSLGVLRPGQVAATAGTSGVIYAVSEKQNYDIQGRINAFAHVNHTSNSNRIGLLGCINGCGSMLKWAKQTFAPQKTYEALNTLALGAKIGSNGVQFLPFGNGAERILSNKILGASYHGLKQDNTQAEIFRATQEGIAAAMALCIRIFEQNGQTISMIRAGKANLFQSEVFTKALAGITGVGITLLETDGAKGAALASGVGSAFDSAESATEKIKILGEISPENSEEYTEFFNKWKEMLERLFVHLP